MALANIDQEKARLMRNLVRHLPAQSDLEHRVAYVSAEAILSGNARATLDTATLPKRRRKG